MTKYIIGEILSSGGATLYKNPSDQTVSSLEVGWVYSVAILTTDRAWVRAFVTLISFLPGTCQGKSSAKKVQSIHTLFEKKGALCLG